eukprot:Stramenopile-MAST_4_protein_1033
MSRIFQAAVDEVSKTLETTRNPVLAENVTHTYDDKYNLAAWTTSIAGMATFNVLEIVGFTPDILEQALKWSNQGKSVTLRLHGEETCTFVGETTREVKSAQKHVTTNTLFGQTTTETVTTVKESTFALTSSWEICLFNQTEFPRGTIPLAKRSGSINITQVSSKNPPYPLTKSMPYVDLSLNWFLGLFNGNGQMEFRIDRSVDSCRTPRRNNDIDQAFHFFGSLKDWASRLGFTMEARVEIDYKVLASSENPNGGIDLAGYVHGGDSFVPIVPLMEETTNAEEGTVTARCLTAADTHAFLSRQKQALADKIAKASAVVASPEEGKLVSRSEIQAAIAAMELQQISHMFGQSLEYIEGMLYQQLSAAIGKAVDWKEFEDYMNYHYQQLFREEFLPKPFCYSIRRPGHYPEGTLSIQSSSSRNTDAPIMTSVRQSAEGEASPMQFALDAATKVTFGGTRFLHSMVRHTFDGCSSSLKLIARARQFSSFILMIGTMSSSTRFDPKDAIIIKDKDELSLDLLLETIPSPKEFKDAIASLSPEQQRFAQSFRSMQLAGTLFTVCVIQIKPQLEKLLNLPDDSLTKEIKLTQQLMELFIEYQVPSDLLSYDASIAAPCGDGAGPVQQKELEQVRGHVKKMYDMLNDMKRETLGDAVLERAAGDLGSGPISFGASFGASSFGAVRMGGGGQAAFGSKNQVGQFGRGTAPAPAPAPRGAPRGLPPSFSNAPTAAMEYCPTSPVYSPTSPAYSPTSPSASSRIERGEPQDGFEVDGAPEQQQTERHSGTNDASVMDDFTLVPKLLDASYEKYDPEAPLRPTTIKVGNEWIRTSQRSLIQKKQKTTTPLRTAERKSEKDKAFDLLDALSRSGALAIDCAELHVIVAATHCFSKNVIDTVIQGNINPIEKVERSLLIVATTIREKSVRDLTNPSALPRLQNDSPMLFLEE